MASTDEVVWFFSIFFFFHWQNNYSGFVKWNSNYFGVTAVNKPSDTAVVKMREHICREWLANHSLIFHFLLTRSAKEGERVRLEGRMWRKKYIGAKENKEWDEKGRGMNRAEHKESHSLSAELLKDDTFANKDPLWGLMQCNTMMSGKPEFSIWGLFCSHGMRIFLSINRFGSSSPTRREKKKKSGKKHKRDRWVCVYILCVSIISDIVTRKRLFTFHRFVNNWPHSNG